MILSDINLRYPIGHAPAIKKPTAAQIEEWITQIEAFPQQLKEVAQNLTSAQLNWRYRPGGWKIKQVIHHCADSHMNSYIRFKLALTENQPTIKPYFEDLWAELPDSLDDNVSDSIALLTVLHKKWGKLLRSLSKEELQKTFIHPEHGTHFTLAENIGIYAWHSMHHLAHIKLALEAKGTHAA